MDLEWNRKGKKPVLIQKNKKDVVYLSFPLLENSRLVKHGFSTRMGGVSEGIFSSMSFGYARGDNPEAVMENYRRMAEALGVEAEKMVVSYQTHTTNIRRVTKEDAGKGVFYPREYRDVDGLMTNEPGLTLVTIYADCVPLYFLDPVNRAIALSHSGWRGTVNRMGQKTMEKMKNCFGSKPEELLCAIGPSICRECYEVGQDVAEAFRLEFPGYRTDILEEKGNGKYLLDLWKANERVLLDAGVQKEHIEITDICTCCNPDYLFSHRASGGKRGNLGAFLCLKEEL